MLCDMEEEVRKVPSLESFGKASEDEEEFQEW